MHLLNLPDDILIEIVKNIILIDDLLTLLECCKRLHSIRDRILRIDSKCINELSTFSAKYQSSPVFVRIRYWCHASNDQICGCCGFNQKYIKTIYDNPHSVIPGQPHIRIHTDNVFRRSKLNISYQYSPSLYFKYKVEINDLHNFKITILLRIRVLVKRIVLTPFGERVIDETAWRLTPINTIRIPNGENTFTLMKLYWYETNKLHNGVPNMWRCLRGDQV